MANRSSRSRKGKARSAQTKKPELRAPEVRNGATRQQRRDERSERRERLATTSVNVQLARKRPSGIVGWMTSWLGAAGIVALVAWAGHKLNLWGVAGYPDSLWLYIAIGGLAASPALAYIALGQREVKAWAIQVGSAALGLLIAEQVLGPACPAANCGIVGARGAFSLPGSVLAVLVLATAAAWIGLRMLRRAEYRRPRGQVRTSITATLTTMTMVMLIVSLPIAGVLMLVDGKLRPQTRFAAQAVDDARDYCFPIGARKARLAQRPASYDAASFYASYWVRVAGEKRAMPKGSSLPASYLTSASPSPYEARVTYNTITGETMVACRLLMPGTVATKADLKPTPSQSTPDQLGFSSDNPLRQNVPGGSSPTILIAPKDPAAAAAGAGTTPTINVG